MGKCRKLKDNWFTNGFLVTAQIPGKSGEEGP